MSLHKNYAVFGLGRYGSAIAISLAKSGADVLAVDRNSNIVNNLAGSLPVCKCADITDPEALRQLGIANIDVAIIAIADNIEASVMATLLCKEAGVKTVIAKCGTEMHQKILERVGADQVVFPENESGTRLAKTLLCSGFVDMLDLADGLSLVEMDIKPDWVGKPLTQLQLRSKYQINVVAIRTPTGISANIDPHLPLMENAKLIFIANPAKLNKIR